MKTMHTIIVLLKGLIVLYYKFTLHYIILHYIVLYYIILYYIILYYIILYYIILYYNILYYIILYDIILYYISYIIFNSYSPQCWCLVKSIHLATNVLIFAQSVNRYGVFQF